MPRKKPHPAAPAPATGAGLTLRQRAEAKIRETGPPADISHLSPADLSRLLHEMHVYQIELELQNENLREAQEELHASEALHIELYDHAPVGYITLDERGVIVRANLTAASLLGRPHNALSDQPLTRFILRDDQDIYYRHRKQLLATGESQVCEMRLVKPDGTWFWARLEALLTRNAAGEAQYRTVLSDITARKQSDDMLRLKNSVFDTSITANSIANSLGIVTEANHAFLRIWGYPTKDEVLGKPIPHFFNDRAEAATFLAALDANGQWQGEFSAKRRDGSTFIAHLLATVVRNETGELLGYQAVLEDITARKQAELELQQAHELLARFMRDSPIYSFIKTVTPQESRVLYASENYHQMIGVAGSEMVGKSMEELFPAPMAAKITADDWHVVASGEMLQLEETFNERYFTTFKFPIPQENRILLAGYTIDITEQKLAELTLRDWNQTLERRVAERTADLLQSKVRFRQLSEATSEGISVSEDGILLDVNEQLATLHGHTLAEMIGRPILDFVAPESRGLVETSIRHSDEARYELTGLRKDGSTFPQEAHASMRIWNGKETRVTALRDLTSVKQAAAELHARQAELEQAQRLALVSEISAGIIHQIGQPLCSMGANLCVVQSRLEACTLKRCGTLDIIKDVEAGVDSMRDVVIHLRALANPDQPTRTPIHLNDLLEEILPLLRQEATSHRLRLVADLGHDLPQVLADSVQLSQVVLNLVRNAFDACAGETPEHRRIVLTSRALAGEGVELSVQDCGCGIAPEAITQLFVPFFTTKPEGLGIGLRLSQTIVEAHGGRIEGHNNPDGVGATFRVILPEFPAQA